MSEREKEEAVGGAVGGAGGNRSEGSPPKRKCVGSDEDEFFVLPCFGVTTNPSKFISSLGGGGGGDTIAAAKHVVKENLGKLNLVLGSGYDKKDYLGQIEKYIGKISDADALVKLSILFDKMWIDGTDTFVIKPEHAADYEVVFKPLCPHQHLSVFHPENSKFLIDKYRYKSTIEEAVFVVKTGLPVKMLFSTDSSEKSGLQRAYNALKEISEDVVVVENGADGICPIVHGQKSGRDVITMALLARLGKKFKLCVCGPAVDAHAPLKEVLERINAFSKILASNGHSGFTRIPPSEIILGPSEGVDGDGRAETNVHSAVCLAQSAGDHESKLANFTDINLRSRIDATAAFEAIVKGHQDFLAGENLHLLTDHPEGLTRSQIAQKIIEMYGSQFHIEIDSRNAQAVLQFYASNPVVMKIFMELY